MLKKRFFGVIMSLIAGLIFMFIFAACGDGAGDDDGGNHSHLYSTDWTYNPIQHWRSCSCGDKTMAANHSGNPCAACGFSRSSNSGGFLGAELNLKGQIWTVTVDLDWDWYYETGKMKTVWERFTGNGVIVSAGYTIHDDILNKDISREIGGSGAISNGQMDFTIKTPSELLSVGECLPGLEEEYTNFEITPANARGAIFSELIAIIDGKTHMLFRYDYEFGYGENTSFLESVTYMYVDRDATLKGSGKQISRPCDCAKEYGYCSCEYLGGECNCEQQYTTHNINITLKQGWNAIYSKITIDISGDDHTMELNNPSHLRWRMTADL